METAQSIIDFVSQWRSRNSFATYSDDTSAEESLLK